MPKKAAGTKTKKADAPLTSEGLAALINKKWPGAVKLGNDPSLEITRLPTGILALDVLMDGGFARNRHTELYGSEHTGKTYVAYRLMGQTQASGGTCAMFDVEGTFDPRFAASAGVDLGRLHMPDLPHANQVIDVMETMLRSQLYDVIVLDSIASLLPKSELEADMTSGNYGTAQAKLMSQALRRLTAANSRTALVFINQTREAIGVVFGKKSITSGGKAMGFYAGTRLEFVRTESVKKNGRAIDHNKGDEVTKSLVRGHRILVRCEKDKTGATFRGSETTMVYDYDLGGIDPVEDLIYLGREFDLVGKSGSNWWMRGYEEDKVASRGRFKTYLRKNSQIAEELEELIQEAAAQGQLVAVGGDEDDE